LEASSSHIVRAVSILIAACLAVFPAQAQYSGGTGEPNDPYQIATAEDLITLGETPEDYDKYFVLTADIDLDPNLPGRKVFNEAVIGSFSGVFDGDGHTISHLVIAGGSYLGLFGHVFPHAVVENLGVVEVNITGSGFRVGGLVGDNHGTVTHCHSTGAVSGDGTVGGLVGGNAWTIYLRRLVAVVTQCYSTAVVSAEDNVGGLVGSAGGTVSNCYSTGGVSGDDSVGGLVGYNAGDNLTECYSAAAVSGSGGAVGGLVGWNRDSDVAQCYSTGTVRGMWQVGGLVGDNDGTVTCSFWDAQTSGQTASAGGMGKTTAEMQTAGTFLEAGWDFVGETANGMQDIWWILEGQDYPRLWWER